jgi:hypothetical protein
MVWLMVQLAELAKIFPYFSCFKNLQFFQELQGVEIINLEIKSDSVAFD